MSEYKRFFTLELESRLQNHTPFLQVLIGPRQVGKSTAIAQVSKGWSGAVVHGSADEWSTPSPDWIDFLWKQATEKAGPCLLTIDEIQRVSHWTDRIKVLFDRDRHKKNLRVVLSGSASLSIQKGLGDTLAGRFELIQCPHWGFQECAQVYGWDFATFLKFGGYPAPAVLTPDPTRWQHYMQNSIIEPVVGRDLQSLVNIQKPALFRQLLALAMLYPAQEISLQKLLGQLQDKGNVTTIKHYLEILSGGFLLACLEKYSGSALVQKASSPKVLPLCPALIHAFTNPLKVDTDHDWFGRVFEAAVGAHLLRTTGRLSYWREGDSEVDFVLSSGSDLYAIEVKSGRHLKKSGLFAFQKKYPEAKCILLNLDKGTEFLNGEPSIQRLLKCI